MGAIRWPLDTTDTKCRLLLGLVVLLLLGSTSAGAQPTDVEGWQSARWGMTQDELVSAVPAEITVLPGRWEYGRSYADHAVMDAQVGGLAFDAFFQMNKKTDRLEQVLLERRRAGATPAAFGELLAALTDEYGQPSETCRQAKQGGEPQRHELIWRFPTTTVHASFLDFSSMEVLDRDPRPPSVPLAETVEERLRDFLDERRITHRFVPRRIIIRLHDAQVRALDPPCPVGG